MARKRMIQTFREARDAGPYDERPLVPDDVDPQLLLSRNDRPQPFFLTFAKDSVIIQMSGKARIDMRDSSVNYFNAVPGDYIYVPAGTPHRIVPDGECVQYRQKALHSGLEALTFVCDGCGTVLSQEVWDTAEEVPQAAYLRVVTAFNGNGAARTCAKCGVVKPEVDLADYRWKDIAGELAAEKADTEAW